MRENYDLTVFAAGDADYETEGLCGPLAPMGDPEVVIEAGGELCLDFEHPYDPEGRWRALETGNTVRAWVQMRNPPEPDDLGAYAETVEVWKVATGAGKADRTLYSTRVDSAKTKKLKLLKGGLKVTIAKAYAEGRWKVKTKYGTGWMNQEGLDSSEAQTVHVDPDGAGLDDILGVDFRPQLFDITEIERNRESIRVHAVHISYRLMKNVTRYVATGSVKGVTAAKALLNNCLDGHEFEAYSDVADTRAGASWNYVNPIEAIMDPEAGLMARWGMELLRDNFDLYLLHHVGRDRGVTIEVGRNLAGITVTEDAANVATYVMPLGVNQDGSPLLLPEVWLVSPLANRYPQKHIYAFWAEDCTVDDDANVATIRTRMRAQAQALLDAGCDRPALTVDVEVAQVDDPAALAVVEALEPVLEYDTVRIYDVDRGMAFEDKCIRRVVDPVHGRLISMELGNTTGRLGATQIATWQVPAGIVGGKIQTGTLDGAALKDGTLQARTILAGTITAQLIASGAITAEKIAAGAVDAQMVTAMAAVIQAVQAGTIEAGSLAAQYASLFELAATKIGADFADLDDLTAALANITALTARHGSFDDVTAQNLIGALLTVTKVGARMARIENLYVTQANLMNATLDRLTVLGADGETYYDISVGGDGFLQATAREVSADEAAAGQTDDGRQILDGSGMEAATGADVPDLDGVMFSAMEDGLTWLVTQALSTGKLTATEAFIGTAEIPSLRATTLTALGQSLNLMANETIQLLLGTREDITNWFSFTENGLITRKTGSKWHTVTAAEGYYIDHDEIIGHVGAFERERLIVRGLQIGELTVRSTGSNNSGGWAWSD